VNPVGGDTAETYEDFGRRQAGRSSPVFRDWATSVAADPEVLALVDTLPKGKRQPNLVLAAARWHGARPGPYDGLRRVLLERWEGVRETVLTRATQTNEVGRCAVLLPVLAALPGPLALLEVGASAGLCLHPDRYSYRYSEGTFLDPADGPSPVVLDCAVEGPAPLPAALPEVVWRGGIDLNPLDVRDEDAMRWLETLVWPEHDDRRARLTAAVGLVREDPATLVRGDLNDGLPALVDTVPSGATLVVFHSAVLAYLSDEERARFAATARDLPGHWVSNEGPRVLPDLVRADVPAGSAVGPAPFVLALDGEQVAWAEGHGRAVHWLSDLAG
jgi:hypothetical protein